MAWKWGFHHRGKARGGKSIPLGCRPLSERLCNLMTTYIVPGNRQISNGTPYSHIAADHKYHLIYIKKPSQSYTGPPLSFCSLSRPIFAKCRFVARHFERLFATHSECGISRPGCKKTPFFPIGPNMTKYTCQTCLLVAEDEPMRKHLSSSRHRAVTIKPGSWVETVACLTCHDTNIHQLLLARFGLRRMSLLCQKCFHKDDRGSHSTHYTIKNGSLLAKLPQYYDFRTIKCDDCGNRSDLHVANTPDWRHIACEECLPERQKAVQGVTFVSDKSPTFLCDLLGLKENLSRSTASDSNGAKTQRVGGKSGALDARSSLTVPGVSNLAGVNLRPRQVDPSAYQNGAISDIEFEIPSGISKFDSLPTPLLRFPSTNAYLKELSYNVFLEEAARVATGDTIAIASDQMRIKWSPLRAKRNKIFTVLITLTDDIINRFVYKNFQGTKNSPFAGGQAMFLVLNDDIPWFGFASNIRTEAPFNDPGSHAVLTTTTLDIRLYPWNVNPLPTSVNPRFLKLIPGALSVSRLFNAMTRFDNPITVKMMLGNDSLTQNEGISNLSCARESFNKSQKAAVLAALSNDVTILQGPPGTGKTSTICEIIKQFLQLGTFPILVVSASNIAVDNIAEQFLEGHGNRFLRIIATQKEKDYGTGHQLAPICLHIQAIETLTPEYREVLQEWRKPSGSEVTPSRLKNLMRKLYELYRKMTTRAQVFFTTTVVAGTSQLKYVQKFPVVIMDEATQSSEAGALIPFAVPGVEKLILVGDQKQLSCFSLTKKLSLSIFERLLANGSHPAPCLLDTQYRMHPLISAFPKMQFYNDVLKDGITAQDRTMKGIPQNPVYFWDTCGKHPESLLNTDSYSRSPSYDNHGEMQLVIRVLQKLIVFKGIPRSEIGVITPYSGQRELIVAAIVANSVINPDMGDDWVAEDSDDIESETRPNTIHMVAGIMIASVDAFHGREKAVMIMSCVRSNKENKVGFLGDRRRINVALTRAKNGLIIIGDAACLKRGDPVWSDYLGSLEATGAVHSESLFLY